jgi:hypothetical protein
MLKSVRLCDGASECEGKPQEYYVNDTSSQSIGFVWGMAPEDNICRVPVCSANLLDPFVRLGIISTGDGVVLDEDKLVEAFANTGPAIAQMNRIMENNEVGVVDAFAQACIDSASNPEKCMGKFLEVVSSNMELFGKGVGGNEYFQQEVLNFLRSSPDFQKNIGIGMMTNPDLQKLMVEMVGKDPEAQKNLGIGMMEWCFTQSTTECEGWLNRLSGVTAKIAADALVAPGNDWPAETAKETARLLMANNRDTWSISNPEILDALVSTYGNEILNTIKEDVKNYVDAQNAEASRREKRTQIKDNWMRLTSFERSGWTTKDGEFNGMRLGLDIGGGALVGTGAGVATNLLIKRSQIEKGFASFVCSFPGGTAGWGETFIVR